MSRASCSPAPDRDPTQEELLSQWNRGHWDGAVWLYHLTLHKPDFWADPGTITLPDLPDLDSPEQGRAGTSTAYGKDITALPKSGCCLQPD